MLPESIFETDIEMNLIYANRHAFLSFGYSEEDLRKGLNCFSLIAPSDVERARENLVQRLRGRDPGLVEYSALKKNGSVFPIIFKMAPIIEDKDVIGFRGIVVDITQRKKTEEEIRSLAKFPSENPNPVLRFHLNGVLIYANSAAYGAFSDWKLKEGKAVPLILQELIQEIEERHSRTKDISIGRQVFSITVTSHPEFGYINAYAMDITKRKQAEVEKNKLEEQLRRAQKLETIGTLAGGIAHDFNNILTPILGYTDMALFELSDSDPLKKNLARVLEAANRAKNLIEQILLFSKQIEKERIPLFSHLIIKEAINLLRSSIPSTVNIVQRIDPSCGMILADATQIHQVIVNLCTNAWQAMENDGGTLTVELKQVEVDSAVAKLHPALLEQEYVRLTVQDTGQGMDEPTMERIFEPFFTTKPVDKGTGLGLSVVHGIIQKHEGEILVYSEPGAGTVFHVYLPLAEPASKLQKTERKGIITGNESILVVDDDIVIGKMLSQMLEKFGYHIDLFHKCKKAFATFKKQPDKYDLVISDLTMPDLTGVDLAGQIQKIYPGIPIIIMTGYGNQLIGINQKTLGIEKVIEKTIAMNELASAIREVLDK
jgi:PAS domain S-box-containing protein